LVLLLMKNRFRHSFVPFSMAVLCALLIGSLAFGSASWQKPSLGAILDRSHPLARDLVGLWLFNEGGGMPVNLVSGIQAEESGNQGYWSVSPRGPSMYYNDAGNYDTILFPNEPGFNVQTGDFSVAILGVFVDEAVGQTHFSNATIKQWRLQANYTGAAVNSGYFMFYCYDAVNRSAAADNLITGGVQLFVGVRDDDDIYLYRDGILVGSDSGCSGEDFTGTNKKLGFGWNTQTTWTGVDYTAEGHRIAAYFWNRALAQSEVAQVALEPFGMVQPRLSAGRFSGIAAVAAGVMAHPIRRFLGDGY
jgi:hypothetical protein